MLNLHIPLGKQDANTDVIITIQPATETTVTPTGSKQWSEFIAQSFGSCKDMQLEEPGDPPAQSRDFTL